MELTHATHVEIRPNRDGQPRAFVAGTRVRVQDVATMADRRGLSPEEIVRSLPQLSMGQVHAALAYYFDHRDAIIEELRQDDRFLEQFRAMTGPGPLEQLLRSTDAKPDSISS